MKKIRIILLILPIVILAAILYACQDDIFDRQTLEEAGHNHFTVEQARSWYQIALGERDLTRVSLRSTNSDKILAPAPNWDFAEMSNDSHWNIVELPWEYEGGIEEEAFTLPSVWHYAKTNDITPESVTRLVMMQSRMRTEEVYAFKMLVVPELDYLLNNRDKLQDNKYFDRESDLSGVVIFLTLENELINGYRYKNGKVLGELLHRADIRALDLKVRSGGSPVDKEGDPFEDLIVTAPRLLRLVNPGYVEYQTSPPDNKFPVHVGGPNQPVGDKDAPIPVFLLTNRLFPSLANELKVPIEKMLEEMIKNCLGKALYDKMINNGLSIDFQHRNSSVYHPVNKKITLAENVRNQRDGFTLFHELSHALQGTKYDWYNPDWTGLLPGAQWNIDLINIEIAAHRLHYYYLTNQPGGMSEHWRRVYEEDDMYRSIARLEGYTDNYGGITDTEGFKRHLEDVVAPVFERRHNYKHPFNPNMPYSDMFASMNEILAAAKACLEAQNINN